MKKNPTPDPQPVPFQSECINLRIELSIEGRDEDNYGASELSVLIEALSGHKERVSNYPGCADNTLTLGLIDNLQETVWDAVCTRLSESAEILYKLKNNRP